MERKLEWNRKSFISRKRIRKAEFDTEKETEALRDSEKLHCFLQKFYLLFLVCPDTLTYLNNLVKVDRFSK